MLETSRPGTHAEAGAEKSSTRSNVVKTRDTTLQQEPAQTAADKRAEDKRKLQAALREALKVPQNQRVLVELAKR
jgi:hypothetical protein